MSFTSNTSYYSGWIPQNYCACSSEYYKAVFIEKNSSQMSNFLFQFLTLGILRHEFVRVKYKCENCHRYFYQTLEFNSDGAFRKGGTYRENLNILKKSFYPKTLRFKNVLNIFKNTYKGYYHETANNCKHFARRLFDNLINQD